MGLLLASGSSCDSYGFDARSFVPSMPTISPESTSLAYCYPLENWRSLYFLKKMNLFLSFSVFFFLGFHVFVFLFFPRFLLFIYSFHLSLCRFFSLSRISSLFCTFFIALVFLPLLFFCIRISLFSFFLSVSPLSIFLSFLLLPFFLPFFRFFDFPVLMGNGLSFHISRPLRLHPARHVIS